MGARHRVARAAHDRLGALVFDASALQVDSVAQSDALGDASLFEARLDFQAAPGLVDLAGVSLLSDAALAAT